MRNFAASAMLPLLMLEEPVTMPRTAVLSVATPAIQVAVLDRVQLQTMGRLRVCPQAMMQCQRFPPASVAHTNPARPTNTL